MRGIIQEKYNYYTKQFYIGIHLYQSSSTQQTRDNGCENFTCGELVCLHEFEGKKMGCIVKTVSIQNV